MYAIRKERNLTTRQTIQKTREELAVLSAGLDQSMPQLIAQHPDALTSCLYLTIERRRSPGRQRSTTTNG